MKQFFRFLSVTGFSKERNSNTQTDAETDREEKTFFLIIYKLFLSFIFFTTLKDILTSQNLLSHRSIIIAI